MSHQRIALLGYPAEYFVPVGAALEQAGFEIYWVCVLGADARHLARSGVASQRVLNLAKGFKAGTHPIAECRSGLGRFENDTDPKITDIIMMDRLLSKKSGTFATEYLHHVTTSLERFLSANNISLVTSWRDTAVQMTGMLVCRTLGVPFVIPTRIRIPQEVYGFCTAHHTDSFVQLGEPGADDIAWAETVLRSFEGRALRPALKKSSRTFVEVLRFMPSHARAFAYEVRRALFDLGNDYTRYPIWRLITMYGRRRFNLLAYKLFNPCAQALPKDGRFCIYTLHTQPESSIDVQASYWSDQIGVIRCIARSLPATHALYVKVHPTDVDGKPPGFYRMIKEVPNVVLVDYSADTRDLMERAEIVFSLTGTIAYEAALLRKPVIVFANNYFNGLPTVHRCVAPEAMPALIGRVLSQDRAGEGARTDVIAFLARLRASCFDGEVSRTYGASNEPLRPSDLEQLQRAYCVVHRALVPGQGA